MKFMSLSPDFRSFLVIAAIAFFGLGLVNKSHAEDRHPCTNIEANLSAVYSTFDKATAGTDLSTYAQKISAEDGLPKGHRAVLLAGLQYLALTYTETQGKLPSRAQFVRAGLAFCVAQFGPVADRSHI